MDLGGKVALRKQTNKKKCTVLVTQDAVGLGTKELMRGHEGEGKEQEVCVRFYPMHLPLCKCPCWCPCCFNFHS